MYNFEKKITGHEVLVGFLWFWRPFDVPCDAYFVDYKTSVNQEIFCIERKHLHHFYLSYLLFVCLCLADFIRDVLMHNAVLR